MLQAILVEQFDANPLIVLGSLSVDDDTAAQSKIRAAIEAHNAAAVATQSEGALIWSDEVGSRKFELRLDYEGVIEQRFGNSKNLHGAYICESGRKYKYYGKCVSWVPGKRSFWEIYLFRHDKIFTYDGVFNSKDLLVKLDEDFFRSDMNIDLLHPVSVARAEQRIEEWDNAISP